MLRKIEQAIRRLKPRPDIRLVATNRPNSKFGNFVKNGAITIKRRPIFSRKDVFFTLGSCFAEEIRIALTTRGINCVPQYSDIAFDPNRVAVDELPDREHMNFYNTFTVRLQLEQLLGLWSQDTNDCWRVKDVGRTPGIAYQDPYRRMVLAPSTAELSETITDINNVMREGFEKASAFIFTFGMTEVFVNKKSRKVVAHRPSYLGGGGAVETEIHISTFEENYRNVVAIVDLIKSRKPDAPIILTVSPVSLNRTFQDDDVVTINMESKSILRAVLGQVCRETPNVFYLPSFEFVVSNGYQKSYEADRRHVRRAIVESIVNMFFESFFVEAEQTSTDASQPKASI